MFLNVWCSFVGEKLSDCAVTLLWYYMQMLYRLKVQTALFCDLGNADGTNTEILRSSYSNDKCIRRP